MIYLHPPEMFQGEVLYFTLKLNRSRHLDTDLLHSVLGKRGTEKHRINMCIILLVLGTAISFYFLKLFRSLITRKRKYSLLSVIPSMS